MSRTKISEDDILSATLRAIESDEISSLSMGAIAKAVGMTRQGLYLHYPNRAKLVLALVRYADRYYDIERELRPLAAAANGDELLTAVANLHGCFHARIYKVASLVHALAADPDVEVGWQDRRAARRRGARKSAKQLAEWGELAEGWTVASAGDWLASQGSEFMYEDMVLSMGWSQKRYIGLLETTYKRVLLR